MKRIILAALAFLAPLAFAQTVTPIQRPLVSFVDENGSPCAGCKLYTYIAGSTTPQPTYTNSTGMSQNTNPVTLDASGSAQIWMGISPYKFVLKDALGVTVWTVDNVPASAGTWHYITGGNQTGTGGNQLNTFPAGVGIGNTYFIQPGYSVQTAINAANNAGGGTVVLSPGSYVGGPFVVSANVTLQCANRLAVLTTSAGANDVVKITGSNAAVLNCGVDGTGQTGDHVYGIHVLGDISNILIDNVEVHNGAWEGIFAIGATGQVNNLTITNSYVHDTQRSGMDFAGVNGLHVSHNTIKAFDLSLNSFLADAIYFQSGAGGAVNTNVNVTGNISINTVSTFFGIESASPSYNNIVDGCTISDNVWDGGGLNANGISGYFFHCSMTGNTHKNGAGTHRSGYEVEGIGDTIASNVIQNGTIAITPSTSDTSQIQVIGNIITNDSANGVGDGSCVQVGGGGGGASTDISIVGNVCTLTNASPQSGFFIGTYGTSTVIHRILVSNNTTYCTNSGGTGFRLTAAATSTDVTFSGNNAFGCATGLTDFSDSNHTTAITITGNNMSGNTTPISLTDSTVIRKWDNITVAADAIQYFQSGASITNAGEFDITSVKIGSGVVLSDNQGNGAKVQHSTGTFATDDCTKFDANGNTVTSGAKCQVTPRTCSGSAPNESCYETFGDGTIHEFGTIQSGTLDSGALPWGLHSRWHFRLQFIR